jgi:hypothetical protein
VDGGTWHARRPDRHVGLVPLRSPDVGRRRPIAAGAAVTGATQQGVARAWTATLGAGLFSALVVVVLGVVMAGERAIGSAPPTVAQSAAAAVAGLGGAAAASVAAAALASSASRGARVAVPTAVGVVVAVGVGWLLA